MFEAETEKYACEIFIIKKGNYISEKINDSRKEINVIGTTFQKILTGAHIDTNGYCVEMYLNGTDVLCLVKLDDEKLKFKK